MKYAWIEKHRDQFHVTRMCRQLKVSRTGFCQWSTRAPSDRSMANAVLDAQVAALHTQSKRSYGRPASCVACARKVCGSVTSECERVSSVRGCAPCISAHIA